MKGKNDSKEKIIENSKENEESGINPNQLSRKIRLLFFILFIILTFLFNLEAMGLIDKEFKYKTFYHKMASFFILCLFPITEYDKMKSIMMFLPSIVLFYFNITFIELSPTFLSFLSFFTKIYSLAYLRIWIEQFAMIKYKTLFIYMLNIIAFTGDKISLVITNFISFKYNQVKILIIQFLIFIVFFFTPDIYFFVHNQYFHFHKQVNNNVSEKNSNENKDKKKENKDDFEIISYFLNVEKEEKEKEKELKKNKYKNILQIFLNPCYLWSILGKASIYFLGALIDYALVDHCNKILKKDEKDKIINNYDFLVSILSIIGSVLGGILSIFIGGYDDIKSCIIVAISSTITVIANFYLLNSDSFFSVFGSIFILFFFINVSMGDIEGFIIQSIPLKYKEFGLNFCGLISTIGCFLARCIYDYIKNTFEKSNQFFAWKFCLIFFLFGYFSILLACTYRYRDINKIIEKEKKEIELETFENEEDNNKLGGKDDNGSSSSYDDDKNEEYELRKLRFNSIKTFDSLNS